MRMKTYSLNLETRTQSEAGDLRELLWHYRAKLNQILQDTWRTIQWNHQKIKGKKQVRLIPAHIRGRVGSRRELRDRYLEGWSYAAHWVDSAIKTAHSVMESWRKNYLKGKRKPKCPEARRPFARVKQTLLKLDGDTLRVTLSPHRFAHIDLSRRYFKLPDSVSSTGIGEPIITPTKVYLPIHSCGNGEEPPLPVTERMAWDSNMLSMDGYSPETGWVRIDTKKLASIHISSFEKRRSVQRKATRSKRARRVLARYRRRERNRARKHQVEVARVMRSLSDANGFEALRKEKLYTRSRMWNRRIARTDWRGIRRLARGVEVPPQFTSKMCSRCGWTNKDLRGTVFECGNCGLRIDRQLNAAVNLYLKMEGVPHEKERWDEAILPSLVGGYALTGAERKGADELVRHLHDAVKPQICVAYDRYADAYQPMPT